MLIAYTSKTGNIARFIKKLNYPHVQQIVDGSEIINEPCVLITYTTGIGEIPVEALRFCQANYQQIKAVASSGNRNWGSAYGLAADKLSNMFGFPVLMKFELSGRHGDAEQFLEGIEQLEISRTE